MEHQTSTFNTWKLSTHIRLSQVRMGSRSGRAQAETYLNKPAPNFRKRKVMGQVLALIAITTKRGSLRSLTLYMIKFFVRCWIVLRVNLRWIHSVIKTRSPSWMKKISVSRMSLSLSKRSSHTSTTMLSSCDQIYTRRSKIIALWRKSWRQLYCPLRIGLHSCRIWSSPEICRRLKTR